METVKVCVNLSAAELGQIDVLIAQGVFTSRTDVVRAALRRVFDEHSESVRRVVTGNTGVGFFRITSQDLKACVSSGTLTRATVVGILQIDTDVTPDLADAAIASLTVYGSLRADPAVLKRLAGRATMVPGRKD